MDEQWASGLESELRWLARLLGAVRDLDVLRERLRTASTDGQLSAAERHALTTIQRVLGKRHREAQKAMIEGLRSERYKLLVHDIHMGSLAPQLTLRAGEATNDVLFPIFKTTWKKLSRTASKLERTDDALKFHHVRKMAKRLRYSTETILPQLEEQRSSKASKFVNDLKKLQDTLGELQDATVASVTITQIRDAQISASSAFNSATKRLLRLQRTAEKTARRKFQKRWDAASTRSNRAWLK